MKVSDQNSLTYKMLQRIEALPGTVVFREDVADMANPRQVSYALNQLIKAEQLVRLGYGIYAKVYRTQYMDMVILKGAGFAGVVIEVLDRLNIAWEPSEAVQDYNSGRSTQVPVRNLIKLKEPFRRVLKYRNFTFPPKQIDDF